MTTYVKYLYPQNQGNFANQEELFHKTEILENIRQRYEPINNPCWIHVGVAGYIFLTCFALFGAISCFWAVWEIVTKITLNTSNFFWLLIAVGALFAGLGSSYYSFHFLKLFPGMVSLYKPYSREELYNQVIKKGYFTFAEIVEIKSGDKTCLKYKYRSKENRTVTAEFETTSTTFFEIGDQIKVLHLDPFGILSELSISFPL
jgi:hypothetical protein